MKPESIFGYHDEINISPRRKISRGHEVDVPLPTNSHAALAPPITKKFWRNIFIIEIVLGLILLARLFFIQVWHGHEYRALADGNRTRVEVVISRRGIINDRAGTQIVENIPILSLWYHDSSSVPLNDQQKKITQENLSKLLPSLSQNSLNAIISASPRAQILLADDIAHADALRILSYHDQMPAIEVRHEERRAIVTAPSVWTHAVGYVGRVSREELLRFEQEGAQYHEHEYVGKTAFERSYEHVLRGAPGYKTHEIDARGITRTLIAEEPPRAGKDLSLTAWAPLQQFVYEQLSHAVQRMRSPGGVAIVLDPHSGEVLALVSVPGFDLSAFSRGDADVVERTLSHPQHPLFNRAVSGMYPIGSTVKPVIAVAALQEGIITPRTRILSAGGIRIGNWYFPDWKAGGHGWVDVRDALAESVNTYFYTIGGGNEDQEGLGVARITTYARAFGLGTPTGIDLPAEAGGFLPSPEWKEKEKGERWYVGDTYHLAIGQGDILATPLQVAIFTGVFANGGIVVRPHLRMDDGEHTAVRNLVSEGIISKSNINEVRAGLRQTVLTGSARSLSSLAITSAGKTGTAQVGGDQATHAWFTGYAPAENPEIVVTVLVENGGEGSATAVPVAKDIIEWWRVNRGRLDPN